MLSQLCPGLRPKNRKDKIMVASNVIEIEVDGNRNECLHFRPLQRSIRGRLDLMRIGEPMSKMLTTDYPDPIPV